MPRPLKVCPSCGMRRVSNMFKKGDDPRCATCRFYEEYELSCARFKFVSHNRAERDDDSGSWHNIIHMLDHIHDD